MVADTNPYVGPRTFTPEDRNRFYGRERESADLLSLVLAERLVLFYAQSGAGKSSLINARLIPHLRERNFEVLPIARVSGENRAGQNQISNIFIYNLITTINQDLPSDVRQPAEILTTLTLNQFLGSDEELQTEGRAPDTSVVYQVLPHVLIIDQFEEILTSHLERWEDRTGFFAQLSSALNDHPQLWVVLVMREDYLAALDPYAHLLPGRLRSRFYMERMGEEAALEAVQKPALQSGRPFTLSAAKQLVDNLRQVRTQGQQGFALGEYVEPVQLQVVCYQIWESIQAAGSTSITEEDLRRFGDVNTALRRFYEEALQAAFRAAPVTLSEQQLRTWFDEELITEAGTRGAVYQGTQETGGILNDVVDVLVKRFLLRPVVRAGGTWFELIHDRMIDSVLDSNRDWRRSHLDPLRVAAEKWQAQGRRKRLLPRGDVLAGFDKQYDQNPNEFSDLVREFLREGRATEALRRQLVEAQRLAVLEHEKYLSETGWGVIFSRDADPAVREALLELLDHRRSQAMMKDPRYYREFVGEDGYLPADTARRFLERHGAVPGKYEPSSMPHYLLLVGSPEEIPFSFQYQLDIDYAVGRVHFDTADEYRRYAASVVAIEEQASTRHRTVAVFAPHLGNEVQRYQPRQDMQTLASELGRIHKDWTVNPVLGGKATKQRLAELIGGSLLPAVVLVSSEGARLEPTHPNQRELQGSILCASDFLGASNDKLASDDSYFVAIDLEVNSRVQGLIAILAASNSAGTPEYDGFAGHSRDVRLNGQKKDAPRPFVARLAQRMLSYPTGGALAVVGRIERSNDMAIGLGSRGSASGIEDLLDVLKRLIQGFPVGAALSPLHRRYAVLAADLVESTQMSSARTRELTEQYFLTGLWTNMVEMRSWSIVGDPAVRLALPNIFPPLSEMSRVYKSEELYQRGRAAAAHHELDRAIALFDEAIEANPALDLDPEAESQRIHLQSLIEHGRTLATQRQVREATAVLNRAQELYPRVEIEAALIIAETAGPAFIQEGDRLAAEGEVAGAVTMFQNAKQYDSTLAIDPLARAAALAAPYFIQAGEAAAKEGNADKAVECFQKAVELNPELDLDPVAQANWLAAQYWEAVAVDRAGQGNVESTRGALERVLRLKPDARRDAESWARELVAKANGTEVATRNKALISQEAAPGFALKEKLWKPGRTLHIRFLDGHPKVQNKVKEFACEWTKYANIKFEFDNSPQAEIRISFMQPGSSWSYIGTDALLIPQVQPTMNYGWFNPKTSDDEYSRVVLHEFGQALGLILQHQSPIVDIPWDIVKVIRFYQGPPNFWSEAKARAIMLTKYPPEQMAGRKKFDPYSIMQYPISNELTTGGFEIPWLNKTLSEIDKATIAQIYPFDTDKPGDGPAL